MTAAWPAGPRQGPPPGADGPPPPSLSRGPGFSLVVAAGAVVGVAVMVWAFSTMSYDTWPVLVIGPILVALTAPLARREAQAMGDPFFARVILFAVCTKIVGSVARFIVAFDVYEGVADARKYDLIGTELAQQFRSGDFDLGEKTIIGTRFIEVVTGAVYAVIGPSRIGGFLVFAWFGFLGLFLFVKAHRMVMGPATTHRYALLTFFLPSLAFWSSSVGKEAWMTMALGLTAYGFAKILTQGLRGAPLVALGLYAAALVRPHVALICAASLMIGLALARGGRMQRVPSGAKALALIVLIAGTATLFSEVESFLEVDSLNSETATNELDETEEQTSQGGSKFKANRARSPAQLPLAAFTVLFRPLPGEANNVQGIMAGFEGLLLLGLCLYNAPTLLRAPKVALTQAYVGFSIAYCLGFIYAFSAVGNFGILVRQRVQMLPLLLVLLALPRFVPPQHPVNVAPARPASAARAARAAR